MVEHYLLYKNNKYNADKGKERGDGAYVKGDQLSGDGSSDIGAHDNPDRLL